MNNENKKFMKLCSFYVSDWHLVTMLLPYINKQINEETKIATIIENDIKDKVEVLVKKLNLKNQEKILKINWKSKKNNNKYVNISKTIDNYIGNNILIIVNGKKEYIDNVNKNIDKYIEKNKEKLDQTNTNIKIV